MGGWKALAGHKAAPPEELIRPGAAAGAQGTETRALIVG